MLRKTVLSGMMLGIMAMLLSGCFHAGELAQVRREIEREVPEADFEKEVELTLGPMTLGFVRLLTAFVPDIRQERGLLKEIDRIKVAAYRVKSMPLLDSFTPPWSVRRLLEHEDWEVVAKARDREEVFWLLYRIQGDAVRDFYVVGLNAKELFLVHMEGRLDQFVAHAVQMNPEGISGLFRDGDWDDWGEVAGADKDPVIHSREIRNATLPDFWEVEQEGMLGRYNRVDGLYMALRFPPAYREGRALYGELGYAFGGDYWRYQAGAELFPFYWMNGGPVGHIPSGLVALGAEVHSLTDTDDKWVISEEENSLTSLFVRRDFLDYYRRSGWSVYAAHDMGSWLRATGRVLQDDFTSLENSVGWSVFSNDWARDDFRPNPAVDEIQVNSLRGELQMDTRDSHIYPGTGWLATGLAERAGGFLGGDGDFERYLVDVRRYQTLGAGMRMDLRARLGTSRGTLPVQYLYELGGFSSLRGYRFKEFAGDRMALVNGEVWVDANQFWDEYWFLDGMNVGAFVDAGTAWFDALPADPAPAGGQALDEADFKVSAGWAVDLEDFRIHFARRLDGEGDGWDVSFRLSRSF